MKIIIEGDPIAWKRPSQGRKGIHVWRYDSQKEDKERFQWLMQAQWNNAFDNPTSTIAEEARSVALADVLAVNLTFLFKPNKSDSERLKNAKAWGIIPHKEKPDWDNLAKFVMDCGNGLLWSDDKIVNCSVVRKDYSNKPRTIIEIMTKENLNTDSKTRKILEVFGPEKLNQFVEDVKKFDYLSKASIADHSGEGCGLAKGEWQSRAAMLLAEFAEKHSPALHLINKYKAIRFPENRLPIC